MLNGVFLGHYPSHFSINPIVSAFIISETFLWASWNFIVPILGIFVVRELDGGSIETTAAAYSFYLLSRAFFSLISGKLINAKPELFKFMITIIGIVIISIMYVGLVLVQSVWLLFIFFAIAGMGIGMASPAKNSLFSMHLDKHKEANEWGVLDASVLLGTALSAGLGGFIAKIYGFRILFVIVAVLNILSIIPYLLYLDHTHSSKNIFKFFKR